MAGYSATLPISTDPNDGFQLLKNLKSVALQNLKMLLFTEPGERIWDLNYGVGIKRYLFEQNSNFNRVEIEKRIRTQISNYLPYINIINLNIQTLLQDDQESLNLNGIKISIFFNIAGLGDIYFEESFAG